MAAMGEEAKFYAEEVHSTFFPRRYYYFFVCSDPSEAKKYSK
jgi:hypothetical protein